MSDISDGTGDNGDNGDQGGNGLLPYDQWVEDSLRNVVRSALDHIATHGLPGEHHCYITFHTTFAGVQVPGPLRAQHPDTMTIVLQYQYEDLDVQDDHFAVTLRFGGKPQRLIIPFAAIAAFHDPAVNFGLQLNVRELAAAAAESAELLSMDPPEGLAAFAPTDTAPSQDGGAITADADVDEKTGEVIALDQFRKK